MKTNYFMTTIIFINKRKLYLISKFAFKKLNHVCYVINRLYIIKLLKNNINYFKIG